MQSPVRHVNTFVVEQIFRESQHTRVDAANKQTQEAGTDEKEGAVWVEDKQEQLCRDHSNLQEEQHNEKKLTALRECRSFITITHHPEDKEEAFTSLIYITAPSNSIFFTC